MTLVLMVISMVMCLEIYTTKRLRVSLVHVIATEHLFLMGIRLKVL